MADILSDFKELMTRHQELTTIKMKADAELEARKRALRTAMEECTNDGYDPNTLDDEIKKTEEVLQVKLKIFRADLDTAEEQLRPMMKEIG